MLAREVRVSQLEDFRIWQTTEELDFDWLKSRLLGERLESEEMQAGKALHKALEEMDSKKAEIDSLYTDHFRFDFNCPVEVELPTIREQELCKYYGDVLVVGHLDGIVGNTVIDYKTTGNFQPDRFMESYQWRFYLDLSDCDQFIYQIFEVKPFGPKRCYSISKTHLIKHYRYPTLHEDCEQMVRDYQDVVLDNFENWNLLHNK